MIKVTTFNNVDEVFARIKKVMPSEFHRGVLLAAEHTAGEIRREVASTFKQRTGGLGRSFRATLLETRQKLTRGGAYSDLSYARIQNDGGTITPRNMQNLAVPVSDKAKTTVGLWPRHWPKDKLHFIKRRGGPPLLVEFQGNMTILHYVLKKSVQIKPTGYLERAAKKARKQVKIIMGNAADVAVNKGLKK